MAHWTVKRAAVALVGEELRRRGWTLHGWSDDASDSMTDLWCPASWDGVAEHASGAVACVNVARYTVESRLGQGWPAFGVNPPNCSWHVEQGGRKLDQGTGVFSIPEPNGHREPDATIQRDKLKRLCDRIERAVRSREVADLAEPGQAAGEGVTLRQGTREGFVEVRFAAKPAREFLDELKGSGFRWARRSRCWYGPAARLPKRYGVGAFEPWHAPDIDIAAGY